MRQSFFQTYDARILRQVPTPAEALLWQALRRRQLGGAKFRRQAPVGPWLLPFVCAKRRLAVALYDSATLRTEAQEMHTGLRARGWRVLWLAEDAVCADLAGALTTIEEALNDD
ncbi:DUF559 domain-containing protein [Salipiger abyssi]|uniref:DUF559 domain-containing protein n=1 Tax=Salipiger abyssi TaxID=1250539 RepID=UPI001A90B74A|nr:DUF559 domain-containing protein [Salipiger abyssi]MBN9887365.1 DUF559 domain-containing protein [Salipiger abyssi]